MKIETQDTHKYFSELHALIYPRYGKIGVTINWLDMYNGYACIANHSIEVSIWEEVCRKCEKDPGHKGRHSWKRGYKTIAYAQEFNIEEAFQMVLSKTKDYLDNED